MLLSVSTDNTTTQTTQTLHLQYIDQKSTTRVQKKTFYRQTT